MAELGKFELWAWGLCFALQAGVLALRPLMMATGKDIWELRLLER